MTPAGLIQSAWALVSVRHTKCHGSIFGAVVNGRAAPVLGIGEIAGPRLATGPVLINIEQGETIRDYLSRVQRHLQEQIPYEQVGLQSIWHLGELQESLCRFQTLLVIQLPLDPMCLKVFDGYDPNTEPHPHVHVSNSFTPYALRIRFIPNGRGFATTAFYDSDAISPEQMGSYMDQLQTVLDQLTASDGIQVKIRASTGFEE